MAEKDPGRNEKEKEGEKMRIVFESAFDPEVIGYCAGCGGEIYSDEAYYKDGEEMIHATGRIVGVKDGDRTVGVWTCLFAYLQLNALQDEAAALLGMERKN